jgi:2-methylcitrate dehydratase PrpD
MDIMGANKGLEKKLAKYVSQMRFENLTSAAVSSAKRSTLDILAAMLAGSTAKGIDTLVALSGDLGGGCGEAHVIGHPNRMSPLSAVWCNGTMARSLEIDDCVNSLPVHPSASAVPALLTLSEIKKGLSGRDFLTALAVGQDVIIRMGLTVRENAMESGRNNLFKIFGPTAAVARALGLDPDRTLHALGIAYSFAIGDGQCAVDAKALTLQLQQGNVAQGALLSGLLAERDFTGAREFLLGRFGYLIAYEPNPRLEFLTNGLGREFMGEQISIKPFSSCRATHPAIDLALGFSKAYALNSDSIQKITVRVNPELHNLVAIPHEEKINPASVHDAQFSIQFTVAAALIRGDMFLRELAPDVRSDKRILDLARRIRVEPDASLRTESVLGRTILEIDIPGQEKIKGEMVSPLGSPERPMSWEDCGAKLMKCANYAFYPPERNRLKELIDRVECLEEVEDVSVLFLYLQGENKRIDQT